MKMKDSENTGICQIHNIKYYNLKPRAINYMSYNKNSRKLALTRDDASIEIWDVSLKPVLLKVIANSNDESIEALCWCNDRLFSAGIAGDITEWDLKLLKPKRVTTVTGDAVWCLDVDRKNELIVAGTENGYLNVFGVQDECDELNYVKLLDKQEGKIICCKFDWSSKCVVTGSVDCIRVWNILTGHVLHKMTVGRTGRNTQTYVWALHVFQDFSIVTGDSRGNLSFWDGNIGSQIDSHQALRADVLSIAVNDEETTLLCSGADHIIKSYRYTAIKKDKQVQYQWVKAYQKNYHNSEVKTMVCAANYLLSGGLDGYLFQTYHQLLKPIFKFGPFINNSVLPCEEQRLTLFKYINYLELWKLGEAENNGLTDNSEVALTTIPEKILQLRSYNEETIVTANISPDGKWLIYSTNFAIRFFKLTIEHGQKLELKPIKNVPDEFKPCNKTIFSADSKTLYLYSTNGVINVFELTDDEIDLKQSIEITKYIKDLVHIITIDTSGKYLVCAGLCNNISVWELKKNGQFNHYINLPKYKFPPTALSIRPNSFTLTVVFVDQKIFEYDLDELRFSFSSYYIFPASMPTFTPIQHIIHDPRNDDVIILANDLALCVIDKQVPATELNTKYQKVISSESESRLQQNSHNLRIVKCYEHLIHVSWLSRNEMVAVEVTPISISEQMPPTFKRKVYGQS